MDEQTGLKLNGNHYEIEVNAYTIEQVRQQFQLDLLACFENQDVIEKLSDPAMFINVLRVLMEESCERYGTEGDKDFAKLFKNGDIIDEATRCFRNALIAFFPSHQRTPLRKLMEMETEAIRRMTNKQQELLDGESLQRMIDLQLDELERKFSSALESLESEILAGEHSAN